ncbi:hypothetical protein DB346_07485 [Verrucomicrobia bacterium LW23]|nr:hypothetical protein DB346_07485 [Verrucomicrobia bacterium LW23]
MPTTQPLPNTLTPRQTDLLIRAAQSHLRALGYPLGATGPHRDGVDGDIARGTLTLDALRQWGDQLFPETAAPLPERGSLAHYQLLYDTMRITGPAAEIDAVVRRARSGRPRYQAVAEQTGVPWHVIATLHALESDGSFAHHLHNGDPLTARTRRVPAGRPPEGKPPFTWEQSARDALTHDGLAGLSPAAWTIPATLRRLELFNGPGYLRRNTASPYLWSMTSHYTRGKFVRDGVYDATAISRQVGAAVLLQRLQDKEVA